MLALVASCAGPTPLEARGAEAVAGIPTPTEDTGGGSDADPAPTVSEADTVESGPRIGSVKWSTMIWQRPLRARGDLAIGRLRIGTAVRLRSGAPILGGGCPRGWYAIEPVGYVCADDTTTFDFESPYWRALSSVNPGADGPLPFHYALSAKAPMYTRIPTPQEQEFAEQGYPPKGKWKPLGDWGKVYEWLANTAPEDAVTPSDEIPSFYKGHEGIPGSPWHPARPKVHSIPAGSALSYTKAFRAAGRVWLLTPELFLVPADRVYPYRRSAFHGVTLDDEMRLPLAWVRGPSAKKYRKTSDGFEDTGKLVPRHAHVALTGVRERAKGVVHHETREDGVWLAAGKDVSVATQETTLHEALDGNERWIEARIMSGTMVAYEGRKPVWATLWSAGTGGLPIPGQDPVAAATTELGLFSIEWKDRVATMSPDKGTPTVFWLADVPHIQYLHGPMAMHVAYWHDNFGHRMSAQCLNVSPEDAAWLFNFMKPALPPGWGAVRPSLVTGRSTRVHIRP